MTMALISLAGFAGARDPGADEEQFHDGAGFGRLRDVRLQRDRGGTFGLRTAQRVENGQNRGGF